MTRLPVTNVLVFRHDLPGLNILSYSSFIVNNRFLPYLSDESAYKYGVVSLSLMCLALAPEAEASNSSQFSCLLRFGVFFFFFFRGGEL